ncbi:RNA polymerase sigma factor [Dactylosporangium siamense]|uniref:Uncharacterized protein n=1 Tax=Dactylosporangium siamense TaxID=685454 RepID=A0A919PLR2_9ACTN|nr:sigma-70 family RNA polymerase sigma factor [Dactylosporangium siamense]GIG45917.1 hypothetical protein Dsi01nite_039580 [Dactylosporangium siamense]
MSADESRRDKSFELFYLKENPRLLRIAYGLTGDVELAKEVAQEVMLTLLVTWGRYDRPEDLLYRLAKQRTQRASRKAPRNSVALDEHIRSAEEALERSNANAMTAASESHQELMRLVSSLPGRQRDVVVLTVITDLPDADASRVLGISVSSVKTHRQRGLESLRKALLTSTGPSGD